MKTKHNEPYQLSIFDVQIVEKPKETLPNGTKVYEVLFDQVITWEILELYHVSTDWISYGLVREFMPGREIYNTLNDEYLGDKYFLTLEEAQSKADKDTTEKIKPILEEQIAYRYIRDIDGYPMKAHIGKAGANWLYWKDWYSNAFYEEFKSSKERDTKYKELLNDIGRVKADITTLETEQLYLVKPGLYASDRYAQRHKTY